MENAKFAKLLMFLMLGAIVGGVLLGGLAPEAGLSVSFLGDFFIQALKMLVIPLVMTSMIAGVTSLGDIRKLGGLGKNTIIYYMLTTGISVAIGIFLVIMISPGKSKNEDERLQFRGGANMPALAYAIKGKEITFSRTLDKSKYVTRFKIILRDQREVRGNIKKQITGNIDKSKTVKAGKNTFVVEDWFQAEKETNENNEVIKETSVKTSPTVKGKGIILDIAVANKVKSKQGQGIGETLKRVLLDLAPKNLIKAMAETKVLPVLIFSLIFGAILTTIGEKGKVVIEFFEGANEAMLKIVQLLMIIAPIGIACLIAGTLGKAGGLKGFSQEFAKIAYYAVTVIIGLLIHGLIILPAILKIFAKRSFITYFKGMGTALMTAFSTSSSAASLPVTLKCTTDNNNVSAKTSGFVLPLGATINMDGTALYEAVAAIFIAQLYGIDLSMGHLIVIFLTATLAAVGAAGIPGAGLFTMVIVLEAVGLPIEGLSMILMIDWFLDRCRTTVNVWGDSVGAAVIDARLGDGEAAKET